MDLDFTVVSGYAEMLSGITSNYDPRHLMRIRNEVASMGGSIENIKVRSETITKLSEIAQIPRFDLCSIDVEGSEINILRSIDFTKVKIDYFVIENNYGTDDVRYFMQKNGYKQFHQIATDECFVCVDLT
jgi:FkbM family methyltransferase